MIEHIKLTSDEYHRNDGRNGVIRVPPEISSISSNYDYVSKSTMSELHHSNPAVFRIEGVVYRKIDGKQLGKMITYSRVGGDFPTGFHESSYGCRDIRTIRLDVERQIFTFEGE